MKPPQTSPRRAAAAAHFRTKIEEAEAGGAARDAMTLRLTLTDASQIKRDPSVPLEAISFTDGEMRYLGVKVVQGSVTTSALDLSEPS
jgi:hypothetical protein